MCVVARVVVRDVVRVIIGCEIDIIGVVVVRVAW